jgi:hypothetical protein
MYLCNYLARYAIKQDMETVRTFAVLAKVSKFHWQPGSRIRPYCSSFVLFCASEGIFISYFDPTAAGPRQAVASIDSNCSVTIVILRAYEVHLLLH